MAAFGCRDVLRALENTLQTVGGGESHFATLLKRRMLEADLPVSVARELPLPGLPLQKAETSYGLERLLEEAEVFEADAVGDIEAFVD